MKSLEDIEKLVRGYFKNHRDKTFLPQGFKKEVEESFPSILGRIPLGGYATGYYKMNSTVGIRRDDRGFGVYVVSRTHVPNLSKSSLLRVHITYSFTPRKTSIYLSLEGQGYDYRPTFEIPGVFTVQKMEQTLFKVRKFINDKLAEPGLFYGLQLYQITPLKGLSYCTNQKFHRFTRYYGFDIELEEWGAWVKRGRFEFSPNTVLEFKGNEKDMERVFGVRTKVLSKKYEDPALLVQKNIIKGMKYVFDKESFDESKVRIGQYGNMLLGYKGSYRRDSGIIIDDDGDKYFLSFIDPEPRNYRRQKTPVLDLPFTWYIKKKEVEEKFIPLESPLEVFLEYNQGKRHHTSVATDMKLLMANWYIGYIKKYVSNHIYTTRKVLKQRWTGNKEISNSLVSRYINIHERQLPFTMPQQTKKQKKLKGNELNWLVEFNPDLGNVILRSYLSVGDCYRVTLKTTVTNYPTLPLRGNRGRLNWVPLGDSRRRKSKTLVFSTTISITVKDTASCKSFSKRPIHIVETQGGTIIDSMKWVSSELLKRLDWTKNPRGLLTGYPFWMIRERALANVYGKDTVPVDKKGNSFFELSTVKLKSFFKSYFKKYFPNAEYDMFGDLFIIPKNKEAVKMLKTVFTEVPKDMTVKPQDIKITAKNYWETHARRRAENFMFRFAPHFSIGDHGSTVMIKHSQVDQMVKDLTKFIKEKVK